MKSRRRIAAPRLRASADYALELTQLRQGFVTDGMGFRVKLHGNNFEAPMSALGQKQTFGPGNAMPLYPRKQTSVIT
jgi:hypothetical protein